MYVCIYKIADLCSKICNISRITFCCFVAGQLKAIVRSVMYWQCLMNNASTHSIKTMKNLKLQEHKLEGYINNET